MERFWWINNEVASGISAFVIVTMCFATGAVPRSTAVRCNGAVWTHRLQTARQNCDPSCFGYAIFLSLILETVTLLWHKQSAHAVSVPEQGACTTAKRVCLPIHGTVLVTPSE